MSDAPAQSPQTLAQALAWAQQQGLPRLEAQMLLLHSLARHPNDRTWLIAHAEDGLPSASHILFRSFTQRRLTHEPVAYIIGHKEFYGLTLHVDARVLDPRPDTEILVEWALSCMADVPSPRIVDLGTGSGAIALAIQHARADADVHAVDVSADALAVARQNTLSLGLEISLHQGSWLEPLEQRQFDVIVSNPPYVALDDVHLQQLKHEPESALVSGQDGLDDIRDIVRTGPHHLKPGGWLLLEHGFDQAHAVQALLSNQGFVEVQSRPDLAGILRCSGGRWPTMK